MIIVENDIQLSTNFKLSEFVCRDGSNRVQISMQLVRSLQTLRLAAGQAILIISGYRTPAHNSAVGGAPKSQHLLGKAADIQIFGHNPDEIAKLALRVGFNGIGIYKASSTRWVHVDIRDNPTYWLQIAPYQYKPITAKYISNL